MAQPDKLRIPYEDFDSGRFQCVGKLPNGNQFMAFVTGAFPTGEEYNLGEDLPDKKRWLAVVHHFDEDGNYLRSESRVGGFEREGSHAACDRAFAHLHDLLVDVASGGEPEMCDIRVRMFAVEIDRVTHGLIYEQSPEEPEPGEDKSDWVMLQPHDIVFHPPWDSGEYST